MAGNYPDVPGHRIPYDRDGSVGTRIDPSTFAVVETLSPTQLSQWNNNDPDTPFGLSENAFAITFSNLLDISGWWAAYTSVGSNRVRFEWSPDTTNGSDGSWTAFFTDPSTGYNVNYTVGGSRNDITTVSLTGAAGVRCVSIDSSDVRLRLDELHIYGSPSAVTGDRLAIWHPTNDQRLGSADLDWGDDPQGHTETAQFRVKNLSGSLTASSIDLSRESLSQTEFQNAHQFSPDDSTYTDTLNIGNLGPGAISPVVYIRKTYTPTQPLGLAWARIAAVAGSWS